MNFFRLLFITVSILLSLEGFAQLIEIKPPKNIATVQVFNPQRNDNTPIIKLNSNEYLLFLFDDLEAGYKRYNYKIEHRNADWSESGIFESEFIKKAHVRIYEYVEFAYFKICQGGRN